MSNFKHYNPKRFDEVQVGDYIYSVYLKGDYTVIHRYEVLEISDVNLQYPERHWKKFILRDCPFDKSSDLYSKIVTRSGGLAEFPIEIYGYDFGCYVHEWCEHKLYADEKLAFHSLNAYLKQRLKKNNGRMKKYTRIVQKEGYMLEAIKQVYSQKELIEVR